MKIEIPNRWTGKIILCGEYQSVKDCLQKNRGAYLGGADLSGAYLSEADLSGAYLRGADLRGAYLGGADLSGAYLSEADLSGAYLGGAYLGGADLSGADLSEAYLSEAYLSGADLRGADLRGADLSGADLSEAYLSGADLRGADLSGADLRGADLRGAKYLCPTMMLLANWGSVSDELCLDLMRYDAANHPQPEKFIEWANGGPCPYTGSDIVRCANFVEQADLIKPDFLSRPVKSAYELMQALIKEKCKQ